jgi:hypothetical protein
MQLPESGMKKTLSLYDGPLVHKVHNNSFALALPSAAKVNAFAGSSTDLNQCRDVHNRDNYGFPKERRS